MRRSLAGLLLVSVTGMLTPSAFGQYPPGYGPQVYGPLPGQYPPAMYGPAPMPQPMWQPPAPPRPTVYVYGPLTPLEQPRPRPRPTPIRPAPAPVQPVAQPAKSRPSLIDFDPLKGVKPEVTPVQATTPAPARSLPEPTGIRRTQMLLPEGCGPFGCDDDYGPCDPVHGCPPKRGHGHFLGDVGAQFLVPFNSSRLAYTTTIGPETTNTDFPRNVTYGPRISLGYIFHNTWGFRGNYWYLNGSMGQSLANADINTNIATPLDAPLTITSPSTTLQQGIGVDAMTFRQKLEIHVADLELLKQHQWMDTTLMFSAGARFAQINQGYEASRANGGGSNGVNVVSVDREELTANSIFEGWGPVFGLEFVHPLGKSDLSLYGSARGSFLWGVHRFVEDKHIQRSSVDAGVATFTDVTASRYAPDPRIVSIGEFELGLQYGCRFGRCYVFGRAGGVYQHWWDVGNASSSNGNLHLVGGTARIGVTY